MTQIDIHPVESDEDIDVLRAINEEVQLQHFSSIIGFEQTRYMLDTLFTPERIRANIEDGEKFFIMNGPGQYNAGYFSYNLKRDEEKIKLSRVFVKESARGLRLFNYAFNHIAKAGRENGARTMYLTVNKKNEGPIAIYEKKGFKIVKEEQFDIGGGFVMDDYVLECKL